MPFPFYDFSSGSPSSWFWDFGNGNLSTNQNPTTVYTAGGTFNVNLQVTDGLCTDDTTITILVEVCTDMEAEQAFALEAYPVPADGQLKISGLDAISAAAEVQLWDVNGKLVWAEAMPAGAKPAAHALDTRALSDGVYLLSVGVEGHRWSQRVVVRH
jgi:PKD repeat protein